MTMNELENICTFILPPTVVTEAFACEKEKNNASQDNNIRKLLISQMERKRIIP